jgi:hypothetical protein
MKLIFTFPPPRLRRTIIPLKNPKNLSEQTGPPHQEGQSNPMFACITGIEYASSISAWNEAHAVTKTLGTNSTNSSGNADGKSSSVSINA